MTALYSEFDPKAAAWLRELIKQGHIADGVVDERDLWDIPADYLGGFTQVHLCAGVGVWSYALRRSGWPDDRPVWTGSFPCQPFSAAGKGLGFADERHLWPAGEHIIRQCRPRVVFGEQVASKDAEHWLDAVQADLEALGYAFGACAFPSAGIGAPHIRDRTYWVADAVSAGRAERRPGAGRGSAAGGSGAGRLADADDARPQGRSERGIGSAERPVGAGGVAERLADADRGQLEGLAELRGAERDGHDAGRAQGGSGVAARGDDGGLADAAAARHAEAGQYKRGSSQLPARPAEHGRVGGLVLDHAPHGAGAPGGHGARDLAAPAGPVNGLWADADWLFCRDGKWRPVEPGTFPLAHGAPARVVRLRGYGNAINAEAAIAFIESYLEAKGERAFAATGGAEEGDTVQT